MIDLPPTDPLQNNTISYEMIEHVAEVTNTPVLGLYLILKVEGGTTSECNRTKDCGLFQVNRQHYKELRAYGLTESMIVHSVLGNAFAAGIILRQKLAVCSKKGYDWFGQIACYHSFTPKYRKRYRNRLIEHAQRFLPPALVKRYTNGSTTG
ncbi:hypothetical protein [Neptunomonas phycophila]|uniref:hypothetical protein n=1 Tax=Neptunomonas phycophila TaxID=1572645 RepID=UPI00351647DA